MQAYVTMVTETGSNTIATYEAGWSTDRQSFMQRAIDENRVNQAGTYVVAEPEAGYLCAQLFHIDEVSTPRFVIR